MTMREEFEAALSAETGLPVEYYVNDRRGDSYKCVGPKYAWWGFKKSREALVIELPKDFGTETGKPFGDLLCLVSNAAFSECRKAIKAAGVKVKP